MWLLSGRLSHSAAELSDTLRRVLLALVRPDPGPIPRELDSPLRAIARRVPELARHEVGSALDICERLGWLDIPYIKGLVTPGETASPAAWLTAAGWRIVRDLQQEAS